MPWQAAYPTPEHEAAAAAIAGHVRAGPAAASVMPVTSCARGRPTADRRLDLTVVVNPESPGSERAAPSGARLDLHDRCDAVRRLRRAGRFSVVHLDLVDGDFAPQERDEAVGPDGFELGIGDLLEYGHPLLERDERIEKGGTVESLLETYAPAPHA